MDVWKEVKTNLKQVTDLCNYFSHQDEILHGQSSIYQPAIRAPEQTASVPERVSASAVLETTAATPSPSSAISNVSSSSSSFHLNLLLLNSPHTQTTGLPVAGPLLTGQEQCKALGTSNNHTIMLDMLLMLVDYDVSIRPYTAECLRARGGSCQASV